MKFDYPLRPFQTEAKKAWHGHVKAGRQRGLIALPTGCHAPGQHILMYDGSLKKVEDIVVGDLVMGTDGPREVLALHQGRDDMRRIIPVKGEPWVVNKDHVLSLIRTNDDSPKAGTTIDISVADYENWSKWSKHIHKLFRSSVADVWPDRPVPIDPYFLGVLIGDGCLVRNQVSVGKPDVEIAEACHVNAAAFGLRVRTRTDGDRCPIHHIVGMKNVPNAMSMALASIGLSGTKSGTKFVPDSYKTSSRQRRLEVLAGLLDTDGWYDSKGKCFEFSSKSVVLAQDVAFICRSLGLASYVHIRTKRCQTGASGEYAIVSISGDLSIIPCRIARKKPEARTQIKDVLRTGFAIEPVGAGEYFGFSVDGDNRYLLSDFTVTHNCGKTISALSFAAESRRTLFLVNRDVLAQQTVRAAQRVISDVDVGIVMAGEDRVDARDIVVASIQTLSRPARLERLIDAQDEYGKFDFVFADEAHHAVAKTWQRVLDSFHVPTCGATATPFRDDGRGLAGVWGPTPIYRMSIEQAIAGICPMLDGTTTQHDGGWLVPYHSRDIVCDNLDLSRVKINPETGDYDLTDLEKEIYRADFAKEVAQAVKTLLEEENRLTIVFCASVDQAERTTKDLVKMGVAAECADGKTDPTEREAIINRFKAKTTKVLVNCQLYVEGADIPEISCVVNAAPTKSLGQYLQRNGRGLRLCPPDKVDLLIADVVGAHRAHGMITAASMGEDIIPAEREGKKGKKPLELLHQRDREFGMVVSAARAAKYGMDGKPPPKKHRSKWVTVLENRAFALPAGEHGALLMVKEPGDVDLWMGFRLPKDAWTFNEARRIMKRPAERSFASGVVEDRARKLGVFSLSNEAARWRMLAPTVAQMEQLAKAFPGGCKPSGRGDASDMLTAHYLRQSLRTLQGT